MFQNVKPGACATALFGSAFLAFGLYHVHSFSGVTEGGVLGMTLLLKHWFDISPAISGLVMNLLCYAVGAKVLGKEFIFYSIVATAGFSGAYKIWEQFPPLWPQLYEMPLLAALAGAVFVGIGAGLCVRVGGAPSGDDALAMGLSQLLHKKIQWIYLMSDLVVLVLSASYIPWNRLGYSILTVLLSGQIIGFVQSYGVSS
ncbi:MAG: YitT family protein [Clostridiaceae bacterium]|nr:YitT family protein [Clostridiaceae bacterium]MDD6072732.1 YitT family protein [Clostridium sp.]